MMRVHRKAGAESLQNWSAWAMWRGWWQRTWVYRSEVSLQPVDKAVSTSAWFFLGGVGGRGCLMPRCFWELPCHRVKRLVGKTDQEAIGMRQAQGSG